MIPQELINLPDNPCNGKKIMRDCPDCYGEGELRSDCCGAPDHSNGDGCFSDYGICPNCREYCEFIPYD